MGRKEKWLFWGMILIMLGMVSGCRVVQEEQERQNAEFVIVSEDCIPEELATLIETRKEEDIKLTYMDQGERYIIIGYGKQKTGGYSIYVKDFYKTKNALYVDTCLVGPKDNSKGKEAPSYPFLVIRTGEIGLPVVFK